MLGVVLYQTSKEGFHSTCQILRMVRPTLYKNNFTTNNILCCQNVNPIDKFLLLLDLFIATIRQVEQVNVYFN